MGCFWEVKEKLDWVGLFLGGSKNRGWVLFGRFQKLKLVLVGFLGRFYQLLKRGKSLRVFSWLV